MARRSMTGRRRQAGRAGDRTRQEVAQTAARIMAEDNVHDFAQAKARAAASLGVAGRRALPRNDEIEQELRAYQALFQADVQPAWLARKRRAALAAMEHLAAFEPRLAGAVLRGTAVEDSEITLHLFVEPPEAVASFLIDRGIPWQLDEWLGRFGGGQEIALPLYRINAGDEVIRLVVFPPERVRESPRSTVDGRPMARASLRELERILAET